MMKANGTMRSGVLALTFAALALAGCLGSDGGGLAGVGDESLDGALMVRALVVDPEFFPVPGAVVTAQPGDLETVSDGNGSVELGPIEPNTRLDVHVDRQGYATLETVVEVGDEAPGELAWVLEPVSTDVPYHEIIPHTAIIDCAWAVASVGTLPCNVVDRQLGTNLTMDGSQWFFEIPSPGLASLMQESIWDSNALGSDMRFLLFHPDLVSGSAVGGEAYLDGQGGSPFRTMMVPGEHADRADVPFNGTQGFLYQALYRPWHTNSTTGVFAIYVNHRVDNFYTFFYHREGTMDFTALPDE